MKSNQLLCTFTTPNDYKLIISSLKRFYFIPDKIFFIFENANAPNEIILTYNVSVRDTNNKFPFTISIHRKKDTNTLYTLNAMNCIIKEENNGVLDKTFEVDWPLYKNSLIITTETGYKIINLNLIDTERF
jgi:hypothetical protein